MESILKLLVDMADVLHNGSSGNRSGSRTLASLELLIPASSVSH
jgi:hypothetical protein